jgi:hypothetical protein
MNLSQPAAFGYIYITLASSLVPYDRNLWQFDPAPTL